MNIYFDNKSKKNKITVIIKGITTIKDPIISSYINKIKFKKNENFKLDTIHNINEKARKNTQIIVILKKITDLEKNIEDIVTSLWDKIIETNEELSMQLKWLKLDKKTEKLFIELLAIKLYQYNSYKEKDESKFKLHINSSINTDKTEDLIKNLYMVRDLVNKPANDLNPETFETYIKELFKWNKNIKLDITKGKDLQKQGLNGIYEVGKWSETEPRMIIATYSPVKNGKYNALIGKWVTFDTGGYNLKPTGYMEDMKIDMAGSATVLGVFNHLVATWYKKNLVMSIWVVENMVSSKAYRPGDVIKMYNGKTVEVGNTDAEWRLVLADLLAYTEKKYDIVNMFDIATLTGAQLVALGTHIAATVGKSPKLLKDMQKLSWDIKERVWELPFYSPYLKSYKSHVADLNNISANKYSPWTINAGLFLWEFVKTKNWVHIDIAWPGGMIGAKDPLWWEWWSGFWFRLLTWILKKL